MLKFVYDYIKTQKACERVVKKIVVCSNTCSWSAQNSKMYEKLFQKIPKCCNLFLIATKLERCVKSSWLLFSWMCSWLLYDSKNVWKAGDTYPSTLMRDSNSFRDSKDV